MLRMLCVLGLLGWSDIDQASEVVKIEHLDSAGRQYQIALHHRLGTGSPVLYVHGSSFPIELSSEWEFKDGTSWAGDLTANGFDVWGLDFIGYGHSSRPDYDNLTTEFSRASHAAGQILSAVRYISALHNGAPVSIIAHSWGTIAAGYFAARYPGKVDRLVLFGPIVQRPVHENSAAFLASSPEFHHFVTKEQQRLRFNAEVPEGHLPVLEEPDLQTWGPAYLKTDPESYLRQPAAVQVPSGPIQDALQTWTGDWLYDPAEIIAPTLIIRGEWDTASTLADANNLYAHLGSENKQIVTIPKATHLMHLEKARFALWRESVGFLRRSTS
ncbi:MAG: alpha/beta hydrolase [Kordiimonas sp.]